MQFSKKEPPPLIKISRFWITNVCFEYFSQELDSVKKEVRDLIVKQAVSKNALEKSAKAGKDQVGCNIFLFLLKTLN